MTSTNRVLSQAAAVSITSAALAFSGVAAAHAGPGGNGQGNGQGKPPAHSQAGGGGSSKAPGNPGHQGDPGHQGSRGHQGNPGHQGSKGGNQGTPGGPAQQPTPQGDPTTVDEPQTPGDGVSGDGHNPPGNNGTIKIEQLQADGTPQNNPHQSCQLRVEWYGFDEGEDVVSRVSFDAQAPTAGSTISVAGDTAVPVGGDPASGAGTDTGLDGSEVYTLSFTGAPHAQQGYHVKVTVHTPYSLGNDSKTKVFWMEPCADGGPNSGTSTGAAPRRSGVPTTTDVSWSSTPTNQAGQGPRLDKASGSVPVPTEVDAGGNDSDGSRDALPFGLLALGSAVTAAAVQLRRRASLR